MNVPNQTKVHIISLGCPKNLIDSEVMGGLIKRSGLKLVDRRELADIVIINTCTFINRAKEEAIEEILQLAYTKEYGCHPFKIIVAGCLAQRYGRQLLAELPEVDLFIGTGEIDNVVKHINKLNRQKPKRSAIISKPDFLMTMQHERILADKTVSAYLKISEGCSNKCTYCVIPSLRGPARSRKPDDILKEAQLLTQRGIKEIIITGQDTAAYGKDLRGRPSISSLLKEMTNIKNLQWIRLLYSHPTHVDKELLKTIATEKKICSYLDLPIQHIDDDILKAMNRKITSARIKEIIAQTREVIPGLALRTSIIVGFPGETKKKFEQLLDFIVDTKFDHLGVFTYSREEGTKAALLPARISEAEKERRRDILMQEQAAISNKINQELIGKNEEVLIEGKSDRADYDYIGRCRRQAPEIDGITYLKDKKNKIGSIVKSKIMAADDYDLFAEIIT